MNNQTAKIAGHRSPTDGRSKDNVGSDGRPRRKKAAEKAYGTQISRTSVLRRARCCGSPAAEEPPRAGGAASTSSADGVPNGSLKYIIH